MPDLSLARAIQIKNDLAVTASSAMRRTPEFAAAQARGVEGEWLTREAWSYAEAAYEMLCQRLGDLDA